jgi:RPA family protein
MKRPTREPARRVFAAEYNMSTVEHTFDTDERSPTFVVTPTGSPANRVLVSGTITDVSTTGGGDMLRARISDPTGTFTVTAGQYEPDANAFLEDVEPPLVVSLTGKTGTFSPDDSDEIYTTLRAENITTVDNATRNHWQVEAAERTVERIQTMSQAIECTGGREDISDTLQADGVSEKQADAIGIALSEYNTTADFLNALLTVATDCANIVAGERDTARDLTLNPSDTTSGSASTAD